MSIIRKHVIRYFTVVEVLVAMGIFLIMTTIMMQFFNSAQKVWTLASKKNITYADARVAMNIMTREIQSMLYRNDDITGSGIYPFWYQWMDLDDLDTATAYSETRSNDLKTYLFDNGDLAVPTAGDEGDLYITIINFISTTNLKAVDVGSDICEIRYRFIPVYFEGTKVKGGLLQRSCTAEYSDSSTLTAAAIYNFAAKYNGCGDASRVNSIWEDASSSSFETVISGVLSLKFSCYIWDSGLLLIRPLNVAGTLENNGGFANSGILATGSPRPIAIRVDMKLLAPEDLKKLAIAVENDQTDVQDQIKRKIRTFSKVIYLGRRED